MGIRALLLLYYYYIESYISVHSVLVAVYYACTMAHVYLAFYVSVSLN